MKGNVKNTKQAPNFDNSAQNLTKDITKRTSSNVIGKPLNGTGATETSTESDGMPGTKELNTLSADNNLPVAFAIGRSMGLREHLENLREAQSGSMNLIDDTTLHLHGLMKQVSEESKEMQNSERHWARDNTLVVKQTVEIARRLHNTMRLKLDTVKALHKISTDIAKSNEGEQ